MFKYLLISCLFLAACTADKPAPVTRIKIAQRIAKNKISTHKIISQSTKNKTYTLTKSTYTPTKSSTHYAQKSPALDKKQPIQSPATIKSTPKNTVHVHSNKSHDHKTLATNTPIKPPNIQATGTWLWPVAGPIVGKFSLANQHHGIDISGSLGTLIKAARGGIVMYSGTGLKGYGNLIIIKHKENFLTAYAHNRKNIVKEGELVRVGQYIAEMGASETTTIKLHFQIRKNGQPIDPLVLLPPSSK